MGIVAFLAIGCQSPGPASPPAGEQVDRARGQADRGGVLAYVGGEAVRVEGLLSAFIEASGADLLGESIVGTMLRRRLEQEGITLSQDAIDAEQELILGTLSDDEDDAVRLLGELRRRRGWGQTRFAALLERNAGLRALVADEVTVGEAALRRAYRLRHGPSDRARLILVPTLNQAQRLRREALAEGSSFTQLAIDFSTDSSAAQGGLLSPIRPDDTSYPEVLRSTLAGLAVGDVSAPVALGGGFALIRLEEKIPGDGVQFEDVRGDLARAVRRRAERVLMEQLARELVRGAEVVVLDPELKAQWDRRRTELLRGP
ncbi:MAG: peptidylprolyl isomerase [Planctomycetota bacterium]